MIHPDAYLSEDAEPGRDFLVLIYVGGRVEPRFAQATCYADAVCKVAPGNDAVKIEVIALS